VLVRQAALLRDEADFLAQLATGIDAADVGAIAAAAPALARRTLRAWLGDGDHPPSSAAVERVLAVARGDFTSCELEGGRRVTRSQGRLHFDAADHAPPE